MKAAIERALSVLSRTRPAFHSEADLQHALAWTIREQNPDCSLRLEVPLRGSANAHLDLLIMFERSTALELKYHKGAFKFLVAGEEYNLTGTAPRDVARYGFLKDIQRLERFVLEYSISSGFALMSSNDSRLWSDPKIGQRIDREFDLSEGHIIKGHLNWAAHASAGSRIDGSKGIRLSGTYRCTWHPYSIVPNAKHGEFKYLLVQVIK